MKSIKCVIILMILFIVISCSACTSIRHRSVPPAESGDPILGIAVTNSDGPFSVTDAAAYAKKGSSVSYSILDLVSFGDAGSAKASKNGDINVIKQADIEILRVKALGLPIFTRYTTVVTGN